MAWSRGRGACLAASLSAALAGCSLFVSLDGLDDGGAPIGSDASTDVSATDSPHDSTSVIDGPAGDAGIDACVFCDDFDDRTTPLGPWTDVNGAVDIASNEYKSAPHSAHFHLDALVSGYASTNLSTTIPLKNGAATIDVDVKIASDISSAGGYFNFVGVSLIGDYAGSVSADNGNWFSDYWVDLPDGGHLQTTFAANQVPDQNWHHFQYVVVYDQVKGSLRVTMDGIEMGNDTDVMTFGTEPPPAAFGLSIGISANADLPVLDVYIDNLQVTE